jgi:hypothetical protein
MEVGPVFALCVAVVTCAIDYYAGRPEGMTRALYSVLLLLAATLAAFALAFFVYLLSAFLAAPSRMYREDQTRIADLERRLEYHLELDVTVPYVYAVPPAGIPGLHLGRDGLVIMLRDIRFTNRSSTHHVSLDLTLLVALRADVGSGGYVLVREEKTYWVDPPSDYLFSPIRISPQETKSGTMCFLLPPETVRGAGGEENIDPTRCRLAVVDRVSGKGKVSNLSQEARASQQPFGTAQSDL